MSESINKVSKLFPYLLLLTSLFIILELSFFIQCSEVYLSDFRMIAYKLAIPRKIIPGVCLYFFILLCLHLIFTLIVWVLARLSSIALRLTWKKTEIAGYAIWFLCIVTLLLSNQYFFPNSKFSTLVGFVLDNDVGAFFLVICTVFLFATVLMAIWGLFIIISPRIIVGSSLIFLGSLSVLFFNTSHLSPKDASTKRQPNIILIGVDALRPDYLGYFGYEKQTPHMDEFLNHASVFANSLTPLARTFPAWMSILTGQFPLKNGARTDLENPDHLKLQTILSAKLQKEGYKTIYATDETRFSNISKNFGFDEIVTPPVGFNDFFLGTLNDFPMSNLLVNTVLGRYLFPNSYGNRPAFITYYPDSFLNLLKPTLEKPRDKPLFIAVHFCLPHFPYFWSKPKAEDKVIHNYQAAVKRADQQFDSFLTLLKQNNVLDNSIVVFLSDHGEALELPGDRATSAELFMPGNNNKKRIIPHFYPANTIHEKVNRSAGHGTDVLGLSQYHTMLAFRLYGFEKNRVAVIPGRVSLLDIKPTILDFTHQAFLKDDDGQSLKPYIMGKKSAVIAHKDFFTESDFSPEAIHSTHPETRKLLFEGIEFFAIDPVTTRLTIRKSMENMINVSKQLAIYHDKWVLALYPQNQKWMQPILVNLYTGQWTDDLRTPFAKQSPADQMLLSLQKFYGNEITKIKNIST